MPDPQDTLTPAPANAAGGWLARARRLKGAVVAVAGVGAVLGGMVGYWNAFHAVKAVAVTSAPATAAGGADGGALSIIVLPFANQTGDAAKAYIADALTSSVTSDLSRIRDAFVIPATTAYAYKDKPAPVQQIGKDAGVRFVLTGSVLAGGDKMRINAQLADTASGAQLWSETFDGELANLFALQDQVTTRIGSSIGREMVIAAARSSEKRGGNVQAADLMLRARALSLRPQSRDIYDQAEALRRRALALQPDDPNIQFALAATLMVATTNSYWNEPETVRENRFNEARALALKASQSDASDPRLYQVMGLYAAAHGAQAEARRAYETQLSLEPKSASAMNNLALTYLDGPAGAQRAIELLTQAIQQDPKHPAEAYLINLGRAYFLTGDNDRAIAWLQRSLQANPNVGLAAVYMALAYADKGDLQTARAMVAEGLRLYPGFRLADIERGYAFDSPDYREFRAKRLLPLWRKAGWPE